VSTTTSAPSGFALRNCAIEPWLRRACSASSTSQRSPSHCVETATRWPAARSSRAQRTAVWRLPPRLPTRAGVTILISAIGRTLCVCARAAQYCTRPNSPEGQLAAILNEGGPALSIEADRLARDLVASRARMLRITAGLDGERLFGPKLAIVNPPLWEIGHVAWFQERWCLRLRADGSLAEPMLAGADALYDSAKVAHDTRWDLPLPDLAATRAYGEEVLARVLARIEREPENAALCYFVRLATFHEDMHAEAFHYTRQTLGYEDPFAAVPATTSAAVPRGDVELAGGGFELGANATEGFVFDNEKWAHRVEIAPFRISRCAVTNAEFLAFVEADGYARREFWSEEGWAWRTGADARAPRYWKWREGAWLQRRFARWLPLAPDEPVLHVNWYEANAFCRYAGRRLPSEPEWEYTASVDIGEKRRYPWGADEPTPERA